MAATMDPLTSINDENEPISLANRRLTLRRNRMRSAQLYRAPSPPKRALTPELSIERNEYLPSDEDMEGNQILLSPPRHNRKPLATSLFPNQDYLAELLDKRDEDSDKGSDEAGSNSDSLGPDLPLFEASLTPSSPLGRPFSRKRQSSSGFSTTSTLFCESPGGLNGNGDYLDGTLKEPCTPPPPMRRLKRQTSLGGATTTLDQTRYIEHLEKQTSELMAELHNYTSPTSTSSHMAKFRRLEADNKDLKQQMAEWEDRFAERLKEEMAGKVASEKTLMAKIRRLEEAVTDLEEQNRDAGIELMNARKRIAELKGVEVENRGLQLKVQALSEMLAESRATKESDYESASPAIPRTPSNRSSMASLNTPNQLYPPHSNQRIPSRPPSLTHSRTRSFDQYADQSFFSPARRATAQSVHSSAQSETPSRSGFSAASVGSADEMGVNRSGATIRARRMRRFSPGSGPKPLILPSQAGSAASSVSGQPAFFAGGNDLPSDIEMWHTHTKSPARSRPVSVASPLNGAVVNGKATGRDSLFAELARAENEALESQWPSPVTNRSRALSSNSLASMASHMTKSSMQSSTSTNSMQSLSKVLASPAIIGTILSLGTNTIWGAAKNRAYEIIRRVLGSNELAARRRLRARSIIQRSASSSISSASTTSDFNSPKMPTPNTRSRGIGLMEALSADPAIRSNFHFHSLNGLRGATPSNTPLFSRSPAASHSSNPNPLLPAPQFKRTPLPPRRRRTRTPPTPTLTTTSPTPPRADLNDPLLRRINARARQNQMRDNENWLLWIRFLVAVIIALSMAVREGPGSVLGAVVEEDDELDGLEMDDGHDEVLVGEEAGMKLRREVTEVGIYED